MLSHTIEWVETTPPACTTNAIETAKCIDCDYTGGTRTGRNAFGHTYPEGTTSNATCVTPGTNVVECLDCGHSIDLGAIDPDAHSMSAWTTITEPTCTQLGLRERTCTHDCGHIEEENIPIAEHAREWVETTPAACTTHAIESLRCVNCLHIDGTRSGEHSHGHTWIDDKEIIAATCLAEGRGATKCKDCGIPGFEVTLTATGHRYGISELFEPTCTGFGYVKAICSDCNNEHKHTFRSETGHTWIDGEILTAPTCVTGGSRKTVCRDCNIESTPKDLPANPCFWENCQLCFPHDCGEHCVEHCFNLDCEICNGTSPPPPPPPPPIGSPNKGLDAKWWGLIAAAIVIAIATPILIYLIPRRKKITMQNVKIQED